MNFKREDLLTPDEMVTLFCALSPVDAAKIVSKKLIKYMFIDSGKIYCLEHNDTLVEHTFCIDRFYYVITDYLNESYKADQSKGTPRLIFPGYAEQ